MSRLKKLGSNNKRKEIIKYPSKPNLSCRSKSKI